MCGIIGAISENSVEQVFNGLRRLEYRGYDSYGIAIRTGKSIKVIKEVGKIGSATPPKITSDIALGHTRWATHGKVTKENAHPHISNDGKIAVVHNGIVENYQELRKSLSAKGFKFLSETDSEIIPNLIQIHIKEGNNFSDSVMKALGEIEGSYAIVAINSESDEMVGARNGSPLVVGIGESSKYLASDVPAFLEHTNNVVYLDDYEMAVLGKEEMKFFDLNNGTEIEKKAVKVELSIDQAEKGNYEHFMMKEVEEQKFTVKRAIEQSPELIENVAAKMNAAFGVFFVGCGTSYHSCVSASYVFAKVAKKHVNVVIASEFRNYENFLTDKTLVVAVSQSGETADLLDAVKFAKKHKCGVISIVNVVGSSLTRLSDETVYMNAGPEICVLSTKSYTSQLAILLLLAYSAAGKNGGGKKLVADAAEKIPVLIESNIAPLKELAQKLKSAKDFFIIGRDLAYPTAMEAALKIKEVSYIHAEAFPGGELKHGTIALIEDNVPTLVISTPETRQLILGNAMEIKSRGGYIIGVDSKPNELFDFFIEVPDCGNANPICMIIPVQILAYYLATAKGLDPDKPRNLAKSVTVK
ncbi:MAG: glutamine--fructose-6-phosphate transaminase (isomerizing) [Candidatus Diapherotrites archaeon]